MARLPRAKAALLLLVVATAAIWVAMPKSGSNLENFRKIREGMTKEEVTVLMGIVPGEYLADFPNKTIDYKRWGEQGPKFAEWGLEDCWILVWLDENGRVTGAECESLRRVSFLDRLRVLFGM
jgi:hypothetical protein